MVFSSYLFLFYFLPLALLSYYAAPRRAKHLTLTALSYIFYGWANPLFSFLLLTSTLIDYIAGLVMVLGSPRHWSRPLHRLDPHAPRTRRQRVTLIVSLSANVALLGFFKYFNFAVDSYNGLIEWLGLRGLGLDSVLRVTLPLGISFYTFQSMSYTIDIYRGTFKPTRNILHFLSAVSMFKSSGTISQSPGTPGFLLATFPKSFSSRNFSSSSFFSKYSIFSFDNIRAIITITF